MTAELDELDTLSEAGARSLTRTRDAVSASSLQVRHTDPASYLNDLRADAGLGAVEDRIVRLAIVSGPATFAQVEAPDFVPGGHRTNPWFASKYVTSSYQARGQLVKLSTYCGIAYVGTKAPSPFALDKTKECALQLQETMRRIYAPLLALNLDVRGGGVYVEDPSDTWLSHYMESIELPPVVLCATCRREIYWSNDQWRHADTKRAEETMPGVGRGGRPMQVLHHLADPEIGGRQV